MSKHPADVLAFNFQFIKLDQLTAILPQKNGKYDGLRMAIIEKMRAAPPDESVLFKPSNGALNPTEVKNLCTALNNAFRKDAHPYHVVYSLKAKAFVIAPYKRKGEKQVTSSRARQTIPVENGNQTTLPGFKASKEERLTKLAELAKHAFGLSVKQLQAKKAGEPDLVDAKRAILYVGRNGMGLSLAAIGQMLELSSSGCTLLCQQAMNNPSSKEKVMLLSEALNNGGH